MAKNKSNQKPSAKATPAATKKIVVQKPKGPVPDFTPKVKALQTKTFDQVFAELLAKQAVLSTELFSGPLGDYALQAGDKKMIASSFKNDKGIQFECLGTNFGFSSPVFIGEGLIKGYDSEKFSPNFNLPEIVQTQQKELHNFLRTAYEQSPEFASKVTSPAKLTLVPQAPNKFASFAREERTCSDIRLLVTGRVQVYRIADSNGKYAILSLTSEGEKCKVIRITLKFLQDGHELIGKVPLETMCELHKLRKEFLGNPFGDHKTQMENQGKLHAWLRTVAMAAGLKDKPAQKQRKEA
jgi:hypothetical protein